ncbi:unnamed protein product [Periconia digitata]|uniref:Uncharacterized protein n=1 Tax=Periconia digitata TaxID=1303443 RepID=A0A9W4U9K8_9PLEO|nr:unnamed protein product [Periconia digitata]
MVAVVAKQRLSWLQPRTVGDVKEEEKGAKARRCSDEYKFVAPSLEDGKTKRNNTSSNIIDANTKTANVDTRGWQRFFGPRRQKNGEGNGDWIPSVAGLVKAGDEGVYTSALFHQSHQHYPNSEMPVEEFYELLATQLRSRPLSERTNYPPEIFKFLASSKKIQRSRSMRASRDGRRPVISPPSPATRASLDLSEVTLSLTRSLSKKSSTASPSAAYESGVGSSTASSNNPKHELWARDIQKSVQNEGLSGVAVSSAELAALSIILGSPVLPTITPRPSTPQSQEQKSMRKGAYGITISSIPLEDGMHSITLHRQPLSITQRTTTRASVTSTLYSKHMACSCIPLSQSLFPDTIPTTSTASTPTLSTLQITPSTLHALRTKSALPVPPPTSPQKAYLESLPNARIPSIQSYTLPDLLRSIASLPFASTGGLPPLAASSVIDAILLVAGGGHETGRLLARLEALIDKVHRFHGGAEDTAFGALYERRNAAVAFREQGRLGKSASSKKKKGVEDEEEEEEEMVTATARVARYTMLLDRLIDLMGSSSPSQTPTSPSFFNGTAGALGAASTREKAMMKRKKEKVGVVVDATFRELLECYMGVPTTSVAGVDGAATSATTTAVASVLPCSSLQTQQQHSNKAQPQARPLPPSPPLTPTKLSPVNSASKTPKLDLTKAKKKMDSAKLRTANTLAVDIEELLRQPLPFSAQQVARVAKCVLVAWASGCVKRVRWDGDNDGDGHGLKGSGVRLGERGVVV